MKEQNHVLRNARRWTAAFRDAVLAGLLVGGGEALYTRAVVAQDGHAPHADAPDNAGVWRACMSERLRERPRLAILDRQISQIGSRWLVRYEVRYEGEQSLSLSSDDIYLRYEGMVSNSRVEPHGYPRKSQARFNLAEYRSQLATVIAHKNENRQCHERLALSVTTGEEPPEEPSPAKTIFLPMQLSPGERFWLFLTIGHDHFLHGTYDPLLGARDIEFRIGPCRLRDTLPLMEELAPAEPEVVLHTPVPECLDDQQFRSPPDSLYLAADISGFQYFRFSDVCVRASTPFRLSFWYLVAVGTEGTCHARITEYQDPPNAWYRLDGGFDEQLAKQGRWKRFEQTFRTRADTTTLALDYRIVGSSVGEMWIDDIELVPLYEGAKKRKP